MTQPDILTIPFGENAAPETINPIPITRQPSDDPQQATWSEGFPRVTMQPLVTGGIPPKGQDFNGILKSISEHIVFQNSGGHYKWSSEWVAEKGGYPIGAVLLSNDNLSSYVNIVDGNSEDFNTSPSSIGVSWIPFSGYALAGAHSIGINQTWTDVTSSRVLNTNYTNLTKKPKMVSVRADANNTLNSRCGLALSVNGIEMQCAHGFTAAVGFVGRVSVTTIVPPGGVYQCRNTSGNAFTYFWSEM